MVNGGQGVVSAPQPRSRHLRHPPALPPHNLRNAAVWVESGHGGRQVAFSTLLGTIIGMGPQRVARGVDIREGGRTDIHIWSDARSDHRVVAGPPIAGSDGHGPLSTASWGSWTCVADAASAAANASTASRC